jgi:DNA polymerase (family 10)
MTDRIVRAVRHPLVSCLAHPTGRLLLAREAYAVDLERVVAAAAESGTMLEINANPHRLDLDDRWARRAAGAGVKILIGPDAHAPAGLAHIAYGVLTARRAWLTADEVANTRSLEDLRPLLRG